MREDVAALVEPAARGVEAVFVTAKNLTDETHFVDRVRGLLPGSPRLLQAGVAVTF